MTVTAHVLICDKMSGVKRDPSRTPITATTAGRILLGASIGARKMAAAIVAKSAPSIQGKGTLAA